MQELLLQKQNFHHNQAEFSVSEISNLLKRTVEDNFSYIRVKGEVSGLKFGPSGHIYFNLKDENAVLAAICWKNVSAKMSIKLEEGLEIICTGSISTYLMQSKYQLIVERFEIAGVGSLMALLAKRKEMLAKEGLFDLSRKKKLPKFPNIIGVITSPTGAVIKDILHRLEERMPLHVLLWPVLVQGDLASEQIARAITGFNNLIKHKPDLLIVARGGGSIEDLWAFNEEIVVRAAANSAIPIISAIGHETDTTLIDYASDLRAPTPTAAAELAVPVRLELIIGLNNIKRSFNNHILNLIEAKQNFLYALNRGLPNYTNLLNNQTQRLDDISIRLKLALINFSKTKHHIVAEIFANIKNPSILFNSNKQKIEYVSMILDDNKNRFLKNLQHNLNLYVASFKKYLLIKEINYKKLQFSNLSGLLESYHHAKVLARGYAIIRDDNHHIISHSTDIKNANKYCIELQDGTVFVTLMQDNLVKT